MNIQDSLISGIQKARMLGYTKELRYENDHLVNWSNHHKYSLDQATLVDHQRFEGMSDPADSAILFMIAFSDGTKGYLSSAYGIYANDDLFAFMNKMKRLT